MGRVFTITESIRSVCRDALDDLITELGKSCKLFYPPRMTACDNCTGIDPIGRKPTNRYLHGGPIPFPNGTACPACGGTGKKATEVSEDITMLCEWNPEKFVVPIKGLDIRVPYSLLQTKFYWSDSPKVKKANYLLLQTPIEPYVHLKFKLVGDPISAGNIIQGRYGAALWERMPS